MTTLLTDSLPAIGGILVAMAVVAAVEVAIPLHAPGDGAGGRRWTNLGLTLLTLVLNGLFSAPLVLALVWLEGRDGGLLRLWPLSPFAAGTIVVVTLDFGFYVLHVAMHAMPTLWRFHRVHHADAFVDVTTTIRQHPGETVVRHLVIATVAVALGVSPATVLWYRVAAAVNGLLEHANVRAPRDLDRVLALVTTWPHMHKLHHSRRTRETNTNYGNLFSCFDRLFGTFTPSDRGVAVAYGLDGFDAPA